MTASVQENKSKDTRGYKHERFLISTRQKTMCEFSAYFAFNKATNRQREELSRMLMAWYMEDDTNNTFQSGGYKKSKTEMSAVL